MSRRRARTSRQTGRGSRRRLSLAVVCSAAAAAIAIPASPALGLAPADGQTQTIFNARSSVAHWLTGSSPEERSWMADTHWRMRGYPPYHTNVGALSWGGPTHFYHDLYAVYNDNRNNGHFDRSVLQEHPNWILRDAAGRPLYIPYACSGGTCPQLAGNIANAGFRSAWIAYAKARLAEGYVGIHIDDVNLEMRVGYGSGESVRPIDPATGQPMTDLAWRRYVVEFVEQIERELRAASPGVEISHNPGQWWFPEGDPLHRRQVAAADIIELERGFNDQGVVPGGGTFGFDTYLEHMDWIHAQGASITYEPYDLNAKSALYQLAGYLLMQEGEDAITAEWRFEPDNWWTGWETDLGPALGPRREWAGLLRRDFERGFVVLNPLGGGPRTLSAPAAASWEDARGASLRQTTLGAREAAVLYADDSARAATVGPARVSLRARPKAGRGVRIWGKADTGKRVVVRWRARGGWRKLARVRARHGGGFRVTKRVAERKRVKLRAKARGMKPSRVVRLRVH